jgi:hypothetical protein
VTAGGNVAGPYLAAARKASEAVSAFIDAGPDGSEDWSLRRGDVAMDAAHALYSLLNMIDVAAFDDRAAGQLAAVRARQLDEIRAVLAGLGEDGNRQLALEHIGRIADGGEQ